jgi:hypothetical protein
MKGLLCGVLVLLGLGAILRAQEHQKDSWVSFNSAVGRFSASFPQPPTDQVETVPSEHGPYTTHLFVAKSAKSVFLIGWVDYDPAFDFNPQSELDANRDNFIKGIPAKLVSSKNVRINGYQSLEFTAETTNAIYISRVYIVGRRPYQLVVRTDKGLDDSESVSRFFDSFEVRPH